MSAVHAPPASGPTSPRQLAAPALSATLALAAVGWVTNVSPHEAGHYPTCAFLTFTGLACPGCGTLRALHELGHGDVLAALDLNAITTAMILLSAVAWVVWVRTRLGLRAGPSPLLIHGFTGLAIALPVFAVLRNLEPFAVLAP